MTVWRADRHQLRHTWTTLVHAAAPAQAYARLRAALAVEYPEWAALHAITGYRLVDVHPVAQAEAERIAHTYLRFLADEPGCGGNVWRAMPVHGGQPGPRPWLFFAWVTPPAAIEVREMAGQR